MPDQNVNIYGVALLDARQGVEQLTAGTHGPVLRIQRPGQDCVLRWVANPGVLEKLWLAWTRARHPALVMPSAVGVDLAGHPWVVRPFFEGQTLAAGPSTEHADVWHARTLEWLGALAALHAAGLAHRDVKPANLLVSGRAAKLIDLDLAERVGTTQPGAGTRRWLAPEVLQGEPAGPRSDLFGLGAALAYALLGEVQPDYSTCFPRQDFWTASGLDPALLPTELAAVVCSLVERDPELRPSSAGEALARLSLGRANGLQLGPPPLLGRADDLLEYVRREQRSARHVMLSADSAHDRRDAFMLLGFAAALEGRAVQQVHGVSAARPIPVRSTQAPPGALLGLAPDFDVAELVGRLQPTAVQPQPVLHCVGTQAQALALRNALEPTVRVTIGWRTLTAVPLDGLESHLRKRAPSSPGQVVASLAADLHRKTRGQQALIERELNRAVELGAVCLQADGWVVQVDQWPTDCTQGAVEVGGLTASALNLLCAYADGPQELTVAQSGRAAGLSEATLNAAHSELERAGAVEPGTRTLVAGWAAAVRAATSDAQRRKVARGLCKEAREMGISLEDRGRSEALVARSASDFEPLLDAIAGLSRAGRLAAARALVAELGDPGARVPRAVRASLEMLLARMDLAQGNAAGALKRLEVAGGQALTAEAGALRGDCLQRTGQVAEARTQYQAVLASPSDDDSTLRASVGLAHAAFLDGEFQRALDAAPSVSGPTARAAAVGALHNLRGGVFVRLGESSEAAAEFEQALELGREAGDRALEARALLNLAVVHRRTARGSRAEECLSQAQACVEATDLLSTRALIAHNLGTLLRDRGELRRARESLERARWLRERAGEEYGGSTGQGSLALLDLEQGLYAAALQAFGLAAERLKRAQNQEEWILMRLHQGLAAGLMGGPFNAAEVLDEAVRARHPLLVGRMLAASAMGAGDEPRARLVLTECLAAAGDRGQEAELFRVLAWAHALLDPKGAAGLLDRLQELAQRLGPARQREVDWRTNPPTAVEDLQAACAAFRADGRTDLEWACCERLVESATQAGRAHERREAARRLEHLTEVLARGVSAPERPALLARVRRLAGAGTHHPPVHGRAAEELGLEWFAMVNRQLASSDHLRDLLNQVLDRAIECTSGRRGLLILRSKADVEVLCARGLDQANASEADIELSGTIVRQALDTGESVLTHDAATDPRFSAAASVQSLELRAVLCVAIADSSGTFGAVYVDDDRPGALFDETDMRALSLLADQAAVIARQMLAREEIQALNAHLAAKVEIQQDELVAVRRQLRRVGASPALGGLVGESQVMRSLRDQIRSLASTDLPVLVTGPSGAGKELVAKALHTCSSRHAEPLVVENMAAVSEALLESELFGHKRGSFTGAGEDRIGLFEEAHDGTLFLDEVADLHLNLQAKLLRVLESGEFRRVGESVVRRADVRLVAATNASLTERVSEGKFRRDLYYRLNAAELKVPTLAQRLGDIPLLVEHFLELLAQQHGARKEIEEAVMARLVERAWPGEVRELRNEVARLYLLSEESIQTPDLVREPELDRPSGAAEDLPYSLEFAERRAILRALEATEGNRAEAARLLKVSRAGFYNKLTRHGID